MNQNKVNLGIEDIEGHFATTFCCCRFLSL